MGRSLRAAVLPVLLVLLAARVSAQESRPGTSPSAAAREAVGRTVEWLARQARPVRGVADAVAFPSTAELPSQRTPIVYGGSAGVLIFLENAAKALGDERARKLADATAAGLLATRRKDDRDRWTWAARGQTEGAAALYVGDAGIRSEERRGGKGGG